MANPLYGYKYNPSSYSKAAGGGATPDLSSICTPVSPAEYYPSADSSLHGSSSRYFLSDPLASSSSGYASSAYASSIAERAASSMLYSPTENLSNTRIPGLNVSTTSHLPSQSSWAGIDIGASNSLLTDLKRSSSEVLYHQTVLDTHNTVRQTEAWLSNNTVTKRPRYDSASNLPIYPQRPGEKDHAHYKLTRTYKFGESCKFDHPIWVPEGGIPDWKELPVTSHSLPERPGEPDCPYFLKTQKCKFGLRCKFNHPKEKSSLAVPENTNALPERPSEPTCMIYMKTGNCKFGANCKFHHPKEILIASGVQEKVTHVQTEAINNDVKPVKQLLTPALMHNSKGLPIRAGEVDCPFYLKTGSCKYGTTCRYNHPDRYAIDTPAVLAPSLLSTSATQLSFGIVNPAASILQAMEPRLTQTTLGMAPSIYPQRPGQIECDYYMKTGECKFGERCKFHHPIDRSAPALSAKDAQQQNVKLTLAGLPRREGAIHCPYYMKTGTCKYGATCKFDHPPPGEVMAMATSQGTSITVYGEGKEEGKEGSP